MSKSENRTSLSGERRYAWLPSGTALLVARALLSVGIVVSLAAGAWAQPQSLFTQKKLVFSNLSGAFSNLSGARRDTNLINAWGIARTPAGPWWVNANGTGLSIVYDGDGNPAPAGAPLVVTIPLPAGGTGTAAPTGIVFNGTKDFELAAGEPARFIFVTEDGTISGWNPTTSPTNAELKVDRSSDSLYKGVTIALNNGEVLLYAANFRTGTIDVFDTNFAPVTLPTGAFTDTHTPKKLQGQGFAPFNIMNIGGRLFVAYAKQDDAKKDDVPGPGNGFVNVFNPDGTFVMQLKNGKYMNSPWGIALAPKDFGTFGNTILVGNFGSGQIAGFDPVNGNFRGLLKEDRLPSRPVTIDGLWGIGFGNGAAAGPTNTLFFAAGPQHESQGVFGTLTPTK